MALRSLLRRIPGPALRSPPGSRMGPGHGLLPSAVSRFVGTRSEAEPKSAAALQESFENLESLKIWSQQFLDEQNKKQKELDELHKVARLRLAEYSRAVDNLGKIGDVATVVFGALPLLMIFGTIYEA
ncbi:unnamed protein product [Urochloa decumbens]|uniref:Uncharacterized protein n=1 Tax=Urochloa decumbens TaxID=240449 RepID=A0ABC9FKY5_9POAL